MFLLWVPGICYLPGLFFSTDGVLLLATLYSVYYLFPSEYPSRSDQAAQRQ